jgi:hypothetical protein
VVGLLHRYKVKEFGAVLMGNSDRNSIRLSDVDRNLMRLSASIIIFQTTPFPKCYVLVLYPQRRPKSDLVED